MMELLHNPIQKSRPKEAATGRGALFLLLAAAAALALIGGTSGWAATSRQGQLAPGVLHGVAQSPVRFEQLQTGTAPLFLARGFDYEICLSPTHARLTVRKPITQAQSPALRASSLEPKFFATRSVSMGFIGANPHPPMAGQDLVAGSVNYILGNDPARWRSAVPTFTRVAVKDLYPGIDLVYYGNQRRLEYDFVVAPGANPANICIRFEGADDVTISSDGQLVLTIGTEKLAHPRPILYQNVDGLRRQVSGGYRLIEPATVGFAVGPYEQSSALVIDPILSYSTLFGGDSGDLALAVKVDNNGFIYVAGETLSTEFPLPVSGFDTNFAGGKFTGDAFVAKFNPTASALVYFTYLGGSGNDGALDLAVDANGRAHVCGFTDSTDFPTANALYPAIKGTPTPDKGIFHQDTFITQLDATGQALVYSTYFGGTNTDRADALALDPTGAVYITGATYSQDFPLLSALPGQTTLHGPYDAFVAKFGPGGSPLVYSTFLGGTNADEGQGIAVDANGSACVTGFTASTNFPVTPGAFRTALNGSREITPLFDAFVTKLEPAGSSLAYSTFLGGTNSDAGFRITFDSAGNALLTGTTLSLDFPNTATNLGLSVGFTNLASANNDAFIAAFATNGALSWSVRYGGSFADVGWDIALDPAGNPFVVGTTSSTNLPVVNATNFPAPAKARLGNETVFVTALKADASAPVYSLVMGGSGNDRGYGIAVDPAGNAYIVGKVTSFNFPVANALQSSRLGTNDTFLAKIALEPVLQTSLSGQAIELKWRAFTPEFTLESTTNSAVSSWRPLPETSVLSNGWHTATVSATNAGSFFRLRVP